MKFEVFEDWYVYRGDFPLITNNYKEMFKHLLFMEEYDYLDQIYEYIPYKRVNQFEHNRLFIYNFRQWSYLFNKDPKRASECTLPCKECEEVLISNGYTPKFSCENSPIYIQERSIKWCGRYFEYRGFRFYNTCMLLDYIGLYGTIQDAEDYKKLLDEPFQPSAVAGPDIEKKLKDDYPGGAHINDHIIKYKTEPDSLEDYDYMIQMGYKGVINLFDGQVKYLQKRYGVEKIGDEWYTRSSMKPAI